MSAANENSWWGRYPVALSDAARVDVGPLHLTVERRPWEWRTWHVHGDDPLQNSNHVEMSGAFAPPPAGASVRRFTFAETADPLELAPALADRAVIATPDVPLSVLPGETALTFLNTPVWCTVSVGDPPRLILEVPTWKLQDTWFGPSTLEGELCYASRTNLRLDIDLIHRHPTRAVTPLRLVNTGNDVLEVKRLRVPIPHLCLLQGQDGRLWTPTVTLRRDRDELARIELSNTAPDGVGPVKQVAPARKTDTPATLIRAFNAFTRTRWI